MTQFHKSTPHCLILSIAAASAALIFPGNWIKNPVIRPSAYPILAGNSLKKFTMLFQIPAKKSPTDFHKFRHHSGIPLKKLTTVFQASGIVFVKNFTMPSQHVTKKSTMLSQRSIQNWRNSSQLFHRYMNPATSAATATTMIAIANATGFAASAASWAFSAGITVEDNTLMAVPTAEIPFASGPMAAATPAIARIAPCFVLLKLPNQSETSFSFPANSFSQGPRVFAIVSPMSCSANCAVWAASCVSSTSSTIIPYVSVTAPAALSSALIYSSTSNLPPRMASARSGPAFAPKTSIAFVVAAAIDGATLMEASAFLNSTVLSLPAAPQFEMAFFMPENAISVFTPAFSQPANMAIDVFVSIPSARMGAPYFAKLVVSVSMEIPLFCPATVSASNISPYLSAEIPASPMALVTS